MSNYQDLLQNEKKAPSLPSNLQSGSDTEEPDEIIELTDVIREGKGLRESDDDDSSVESSDFEFDDTLAFEAPDTDQFSEPTQKHMNEVLAGLEREVSGLEKPEDILADLESDKFESEAYTTESDEALAFDGVHPEDEKPEETAATHDIQGVSEEKMKALLAEVIRDTVDETVRNTVLEVTEKVLRETVDRAVRETVSEIAEKVIREAIDTLKNSIASSEL